MRTLIRLLKDTSGLSTIEYGLITTLIAVGLIVALGILGQHVAASYDGITVKIDTATGPN